MIFKAFSRAHINFLEHRNKMWLIGLRTGSLKGGDVRVLVKTTEEMRELRRFTRIFPTPSTHTYLNFLGTADCVKPMQKTVGLI